MLTTLLCRVNLGHHWAALSGPDGTLLRHCTKCGKHDRLGARWHRRLAAGDRPAEGGTEGVVHINPYL